MTEYILWNKLDIEKEIKEMKGKVEKVGVVVADKPADFGKVTHRIVRSAAVASQFTDNWKIPRPLVQNTSTNKSVFNPT